MGGADGDLSQLLRGGEDDVALLVHGVLVVDVDGAVAHAEHVGAFLDENKAGGDKVCALLRLDKLQRGAHGIGGGIGGAAEQRVRHAHFDQHGAEVVALLERRGAVLRAHLALAQRDHGLHHLVHLVVSHGIEDLEPLDVEAALGGRSLDLLHIADEDRGQKALLLQPRGGGEDAGVGAFGEDDLAGIGLQNLNQVFKHVQIPSKIYCYPADRFAQHV